jgi:hypothetical protein
LKRAIDKLPAQNLAQVLVGADGDRADELAFMYAQESAMRHFWKETENDDL